MRTALICHHDNPLNREVLPRYLGSFSELAGVVVITETHGRLWRRIKREWKRSRLRMLDVFAFQFFYRLRLARHDREWVRARVETELGRYPEVDRVPVHETHDPNSEATEAFLASIAPDVVIARCKTLLRPGIFEIPSDGTFVIHPGICPEYRNAHGCFWALARRDMDRVGATLLRIDSGVDTGPVFAYYGADIDELHESHVVIQHRVVFDNLERLASDLQRVHGREAEPVDVSGRTSAAWGQPRLSDYLRWKRAARKARARGTAEPNDQRAA
jgi:folate-dependent phosphoribosylglycinamide formyltransferase PurN